MTTLNEKITEDLIRQGASRGVAHELTDAFGHGWGSFGKEFGKGIGTSLAGGFGAALLNFGIAQWAKSEKKELIEEVLAVNKTSIVEDSSNNIGIIANDI